jgi:pimeloyl-ACP methyl ester carboxylesterase
MPIIQDTTIKTLDGPIHYQQAGEGPTLLLIHGMGSSCGNWQQNLEHLAQRFRVYAPCILGLGDSGRPIREYCFEKYSEAMFNFMDHINLQSTLIIGHSLGAMLAVQMAASCPERVVGVVLEGCPAWTDEDRERFPIDMASLAYEDGSPKPYSLEELKPLYYRPTEEILAEFNKDRLKPGSWNMAWIRALSAFDIRDAIKKVRVPSLVVFGEAEAYRQHEQYFLDSIPNVQIVIVSRSAHVPHQEAPMEFLEKTLPFLKRHAHMGGL